jgi:predicted HicB family RNase H-like nuclease
MKDVMEYNDFTGSVRYSAVDDVFYGKLEGIEDLIVFEGDNVKELNSAFKRAVEDYQEHLKTLERRDACHPTKILM